MTPPREQQLAKLANNVVLVLLARAMAIFGPPAALAIIGWMSLQFVELRDGVADLRAQIQYGVQRQLSDHAQRLDRIENNLYRVP